MYQAFDFLCTARICALTKIVHRGNSGLLHGTIGSASDVRIGGLLQLTAHRMNERPHPQAELVLVRGKVMQGMYLLGVPNSRGIQGSFFDLTLQVEAADSSGVQNRFWHFATVYETCAKAA